MDLENRLFYLFIFRYFIYLFDRDRDSQREREHKQGEWQAEAEGEASSPLSREPHVGLDPTTLGSCPEPKADAQPLCHPGAHSEIFKIT